MVASICAFTMPTGSLLIRAHHVKHIGLVVGSQILHIGSLVARAQHVRIHKFIYFFWPILILGGASKPRATTIMSLE
jgi:hypothetical protein